MIPPSATPGSSTTPTQYYALFYTFIDPFRTECLYISTSPSEVTAAMIGALALERLTWDENSREMLRWQPEVNRIQGADGQLADGNKLLGMNLFDREDRLVARMVPEEVELKWNYWGPGPEERFGEAVVRNGPSPEEFEMSRIPGATIGSQLSGLDWKWWEDLSQ
jgi:hypothetical protein